MKAEGPLAVKEFVAKIAIRNRIRELINCAERMVSDLEDDRPVFGESLELKVQAVTDAVHAWDEKRQAARAPISVRALGADFYALSYNMKTPYLIDRTEDA